MEIVSHLCKGAQVRTQCAKSEYNSKVPAMAWHGPCHDMRAAQTCQAELLFQLRFGSASLKLWPQRMSSSIEARHRWTNVSRSIVHKPYSSLLIAELVVLITRAPGNRPGSMQFSVQQSRAATSLAATCDATSYQSMLTMIDVSRAPARVCMRVARVGARAPAHLPGANRVILRLPCIFIGTN